ncbi:DUF2087 domain-containing protein [Alloscardovia theropitheci]|uniref:DUF2087 domain-containing protein n=1 Tax=Alloscardovia theropitheci TaxID=2496842 RepID=A0A4R0QT06_9BIFI|nr:DUF2087 domain-containing protein [Alloscardovia theropitheci]TCD54335.1 DUF2087 domain-containing protein [Alloscardovia theropitheci]
MAIDNTMQRVLKQYRIMMTSLRTPKLRERFKGLLAAQDAQPLESQVSTSSLDKPFAQIDWLNASLEESMAELGEQISAINEFLGPNSILYTQRIDDLPMDWEERKQLIRRICERVFSVKIDSRNWLTEAEYTARLSMLVEDPVTIRRYSIDMAIVRRDERGKRYFLAQ